jgi:hypothetical protein
MLRRSFRVNWQRLPLSLFALFLVAILFGPPLAFGPHPHQPPKRLPVNAQGPPQPPQPLPSGGQSLFPTYRVVAIRGAPQSPSLGGLGAGSPNDALRSLDRLSGQYEGTGRRVMPAFELLTVLATDLPGADGKYRFQQPPRTIQRYLDAVRGKRGLMLLDVQPGGSDFRSEIAYYQQFLAEPDVGLSIEPAWQTQPHLQRAASISAAELNAIQAQVSGIVARFHLPQKLLVVHEPSPETITDPAALEHYPNVALILSSDGSGDSQTRHAAYEAITTGKSRFLAGVMLGSPPDRKPMPPPEVAALTPSPDFVDYK